MFTTAMISFVLLVNSVSAAYAADREYAIKAVFLYNFLNYITWPNQNSVSQTRDVTLCILGDNPFGQALSYIKKKAASRWSISIKAVNNDDVTHLHQCNILFVSKSETHRLDTIADYINLPGVLTISDISGFAKHAGIIEFVNADEKIKLVMNIDRLKQSELKASSQLMRICTTVRSDG